MEEAWTKRMEEEKNRGIRESCRITDLRNWENGKILMAREGTEPLLISSAFNLLAISKKTVLFSIDGLWTKWFYGFSANLTLDIFFPLNGGILHILVVILKTKTVAQILFYVLDLGFIWVLAVVMVLVLKTSCEWSVDPHPFTYQSISTRERKWVAQPA